MNSNNSQKYKIKDDQRILNINYTTAQNCEIIGDYKKAIALYNINIKKYNDPLSKVNLAKLYLTGKTINIDNEYARKLLEEAYNQGCKNGRCLLAYTLANGIGGKKESSKAYSMFLDEINENNPDAMVYLEIIKYMQKSKKNKKIIKSLKNCVTSSEKRKYRRQVSIDKFNNMKLGKFVNKIPNYVSTKINIIKDLYSINEYSKDLEKLYNRANFMYENEEFETARRIYKRLALYGDDDSKIKYAKMCSKGIGGKVDIESAKNFYKEILDKKNTALRKIDNEIIDTKILIKEVKQEKNSFHNSRIIKIANEDINYFDDKKTKIIMNEHYNEAYLQYGILLVENYKDLNDLNYGINILKTFAENGEQVVGKKREFIKYNQQYNKCARIAINKLGQLLESGEWKPIEVENTRKMFNNFLISKNSKYTSYISDKLAGKVTNTKRIDEISKDSNVKKSTIKYNIASLCEVFAINSIARKLYTKMCEKGDYRGAYSLAKLEQKGKGGAIDLESAKNHYRYYIRSTIDTEENDEKILRFYAVNNLATLHMEENDFTTAIQLYKIATRKGNRVAKNNLRKLYKEGKWIPKTPSEENWVKPSCMEKVLEKHQNKINAIKEIKRKISMPKIEIKKSVAATLVAATTFSAFTNNTEISKIHSPKISSRIQAADRDKIQNYVIGDRVGMLKNNVLENLQIVDFAAYDSKHKTRILLDNQDKIYKKYGFSSEEYIEKITLEKNISEDNIGMLYCLKNGKDIKWVNPLDDEIILLKKYIDIKKDNNYSEFQADYLV